MRNPDSGQIFLQNTLVAGNDDTGGEAPDCAGTLSSQGYNLIRDAKGCLIADTTTGNIVGKDATIGPLQNNGGATFTHALLAGSPALDAGNPAGCKDHQGHPLASDQRGRPRPQGGRCDIGAYEAGSAAFYLVYLPLIKR